MPNPGRSNVQPSQPSNVIPMLAALRQPARCTPAEMAIVLRRLHRAGIRRGFVLVAPTVLGGEPQVDPSGAGPQDVGDVQWWSRLCDLIRTRTGLGVVLLDAARAGLDAKCVLEDFGPRKRIAVLKHLTRAERSALLEISRGVCTGDRDLLTEARVLGTSSYEPWEARMAILSKAAGSLFTAPGLAPLPATA